jgi:hypothetical protein
MKTAFDTTDKSSPTKSMENLMKKTTSIFAFAILAVAFFVAGCGGSYNLTPAEGEPTSGDLASTQNDLAQISLDITFEVFDLAESNGSLLGEEDQVYQQAKKKLQAVGGSYLVFNSSDKKEVEGKLSSTGKLLFSYERGDRSVYLIKADGATVLCTYQAADGYGVFFTVE